MIRFKSYLLLILFTTVWGCKNQKTKQEAVMPMSTLPMKSMKLEDMSGFNKPSSNWSIAGKVLSDYNEEQDLVVEKGIQVLVNKMLDSGNENLLTTWEHGDLELELEFMMPKGSNSGVYFQSRYEIQLLDSWKVQSPTFADCGGIYQRWNQDAPEGEEGYEGHAPTVNAARAPGLWQHLYVKFVAPKFDANGEKISLARFDKVVLNGIVIHQDVALTGPTRASGYQNEVPSAPLMLQGDHGNASFRNIKYKTYLDRKIELEKLSYQYYEIPTSSMVPNFDTIGAINQGVADSFNVAAIAEREDLFGIRFDADIIIPTAGDYIFHTISDDGSKLYIDQQLIVDNDLRLGVEKRSGLVSLSPGAHQLRIDYYNNVWNKFLTVYYEGPEIEFQPLNSQERSSGRSSLDLLPVKPVNNVELLRGFITYKDEKRTHAISVGDVKGVHYSFDLTTGALLKTWRGDFADASNMWRNRGSSQLVIPLSPSIEIPESAIMTLLDDKSDRHPLGQPAGLKSKGYRLNQDNRPVFHFTLDQATAKDRFYPSDDGERLVRETSYEPASTGNLYSRLAAAEYIDLLDNGLYSIGGQYYLELLSEDIMPIIRESDGIQELILAINTPITVKYSLLW